MIRARPLTADAFRAYGDVLETEGAFRLINEGRCERYHDRARLEFGGDGRAGISLFHAEPRALPCTVAMLERHPEGSQAFIPMSESPWLVVVAPDEAGRPGTPEAFLPQPGQAINLLRKVWHGVLTPLAAPGLFAVVDRIGASANLEEHHLEAPVVVDV